MNPGYMCIYVCSRVCCVTCVCMFTCVCVVSRVCVGQEDYWRGNIWLNINYLALASLKQQSQIQMIQQHTSPIPHPSVSPPVDSTNNPDSPDSLDSREEGKVVNKGSGKEKIIKSTEKIYNALRNNIINNM